MGCLIKNIFAFAVLFFCCDFPPPPLGGLHVAPCLSAPENEVGGGIERTGCSLVYSLDGAKIDSMEVCEVISDIKMFWCLLDDASDWPQHATPARKSWFQSPLVKRHMQVSGWPLEGTTPLRIELRIDQFPQASTRSLIEATNQLQIFRCSFSFNIHLYIYFLPFCSVVFSLRGFVAFLAKSRSRPVFQTVAAAGKWEWFKYSRSRGGEERKD